MKCPMCSEEVAADDFVSHDCPYYHRVKVDILPQTTTTTASAASASATSAIDSTLSERGNRYGLFTSHAAITQALKDAMHAAQKWEQLADDQKEALEMIAHKIGRILNGDPNYHDSWHDIVGYSKLVADRLLGIIK